MPKMFRPTPSLTALCAALLLSSGALAQEAAIRKALTERLPNLPKIDEISKTPVNGLFEVRFGGSEIIYTDAEGKFILQGALIELATMNNLTEARIDRLTHLPFGELPLKDALVVKQGNGKRKLAVFADPNCGYCKRLERDLMALKDVTIYTFLLPILGPDSHTKSRDIWCAKDPMKTWRAWMLDGVAPAAGGDKCDVALLERNIELSRKLRITGTPAMVFEDGSRKAGAVPGNELDKLLVAAQKKS